MSKSLIWWGLAALGLFWSVGAYNRLTRLRSDALRSFMPLAVLMQDYADTITTSTWVAGSSNVALMPIGQTCQTHTTMGQKVYAEFQASLAAARTRPLDSTAVDALASADAALQKIWQQIHTDASDPGGVPGPNEPPPAWKTTRQHIRPAAETFAQAIAHYNLAITQFPALLLARIFGFRTAKPLSIDLCI